MIYLLDLYKNQTSLDEIVCRDSRFSTLCVTLRFSTFRKTHLVSYEVKVLARGIKNGKRICLEELNRWSL